MRKICIFAEERLFAGYLSHELKAARLLGNVEILVNDNNALLDTDGNNIVILDLDSSFADVDFYSECIIGFSAEEFSGERKRKTKCIKRLVRPFLIDELLEIVTVMLKNERLNCSIPVDSKNPADEKIVFSANDLSVKYLDNTIRLSRNEYNILKLLNGRRGEAVARDEIKLLLGSDNGNMCDVYVCRLRAKLDEISNKKIIYTVRNKGYMLK